MCFLTGWHIVGETINAWLGLNTLPGIMCFLTQIEGIIFSTVFTIVSIPFRALCAF